MIAITLLLHQPRQG